MTDKFDASELITARELAARLGISQRTLSRWARMRTGPNRIKIGRKVFYRERSISKWLLHQEQTY
ncbi:helix-turn-helix transcriptional regulator [Tepidamorphus sp. 3E244]|uniref:helix-turn-helix transcriptional regulator n=1 Tax=Tepidamorphus sp. 3E244 TaxID=3385498 RepID=UPI0038FCA89A